MEALHLPDTFLAKNDAEKEIETLMKLIEPKWEIEDLKIKRMLLGNQSCHLFRCDWNGGNHHVTYVIRLFDEETKTPMKDHVFELKVLKTLVKLHYYPRVVAIFGNGICYEHVEGVPFFINPIDINDMTKFTSKLSIDEEKLRLIAEKLVEIHNIMMPDEDYTRSSYFDNLLAVFDELYPDDETEYPDKETLKVAARELATGVERLHLPKVLCHGDFQLPNILWNERKKSVQFLDWEMAHIGYRAFDIAYLMTNFRVLADVNKADLILPEDYLRKFLVYYLRHWNQVKNMAETEPSEQNIKELEREVNVFIVVTKLFHIGVSVPFVRKSPISIHEKYKSYILNRWDEVVKSKESMFI